MSTEGIIATEFEGDESNAAGAVAMFHLADGVILALYPRSELAKDAKVPRWASPGGAFSIGHLVDG